MIDKKKIIIAISAILCSITLYLFFKAPAPYPTWPKKAIIIGASSGIGKALAHVLSGEGYEVGLVARRIDLLLELQKSLTTKSYVKQIDITQVDKAMISLKELAGDMGGYALIILNSGVGFTDVDYDWAKQKQQIDVNVYGFAAMAHVALEHFMQQGYGHMVGISSISGLRGEKYVFTYGATKAFDSILLEGIRSTVRSKMLPIYVTDIKPGFVDTDMTKGQEGMFWVAKPEIAAQQIYDAIKAKQCVAYVTKRWRLVAWFMKFAPDWLYDKIS